MLKVVFDAGPLITACKFYQFLGELIDLGFDFRLRALYRQFEAGEISFGYFARELGLSLRELYAALEERGLPTSNITLPVQADA